MNDFESTRHNVLQFAAEREWSRYHDPKNLVMALSSEVGELSALLRWVDNSESDSIASGGPVRTALLQEIGDVGILLLLLCDRLGIDVLTAIDNKVARNAEKYPLEQSRGRAQPPSDGS